MYQALARACQTSDGTYVALATSIPIHLYDTANADQFSPFYLTTLLGLQSGSRLSSQPLRRVRNSCCAAQIFANLPRSQCAENLPTESFLFRRGQSLWDADPYMAKSKNQTFSRKISHARINRTLSQHQNLNLHLNHKLSCQRRPLSAPLDSMNPPNEPGF